MSGNEIAQPSISKAKYSIYYAFIVLKLVSSGTNKFTTSRSSVLLEETLRISLLLPVKVQIMLLYG